MSNITQRGAFRHPVLSVTILGGGITASVQHSFIDGRRFLVRSAEERAPLLRRLRKNERQVRGLREMLEADCYCPDPVQQANAITAGQVKWRG